MNFNGKDIIASIVRRLNEEDIRCYDTAIVKKLSELDNYELNELTTFGDLAKWIRERNKKIETT